MRLAAALVIIFATPAAADELHACGAPHHNDNKAVITVSGPRIEEKPVLTLIGVPGGEFTPKTGTTGVDALWAYFNGHDQWIVGLKDTLGYGVCYDGSADGTFRYLAGAEVTGDAPPPAGFERMTVPGAIYAVFTQTGLAYTIENARYRIHTELLPPGYTLADAPEIEFYPADYRPGSPDAMMEIWVPIVPE